jgi:hypothetical protein
MESEELYLARPASNYPACCPSNRPQGSSASLCPLRCLVPTWGQPGTVLVSPSPSVKGSAEPGPTQQKPQVQGSIAKDREDVRSVLLRTVRKESSAAGTQY